MNHGTRSIPWCCSQIPIQWLNIFNAFINFGVRCEHQKYIFQQYTSRFLAISMLVTKILFLGIPYCCIVFVHMLTIFISEAWWSNVVLGYFLKCFKESTRDSKILYTIRTEFLRQRYNKSSYTISRTWQAPLLQLKHKDSIHRTPSILPHSFFAPCNCVGFQTRCHVLCRDFFFYRKYKKMEQWFRNFVFIMRTIKNRWYLAWCII